MTFQMMLFPDFKKKALTLSYDDGVNADRRLVAILNKYGLKGTFNLNSAYAKAPNVPLEELQEVYLDGGHEVAVHGQYHYSLTAVPDDGIIDEIHNDRVVLEKAVGGLVTGMAYANGAYDDRVVECLKRCGIDYARTVISTENFQICDDWLRLPATCHHKNPRLMELADKFLEDEKKGYRWGLQPKLFYLWGHSYEFDNDDNWEVIEEFAKKVGGREDVWYATNGEIYRYVEAFKALRYSTNRDWVYNPTATDVYIRTKAGQEVLVPAGATVQLN